MKQNMHRIIAALLTLFLLTAALPGYAAIYESDTGYQAFVVANTMEVFQYPHTLSKLLGTMSFGEDVRVMAWQDAWIKVKNHKGDIGYCERGSLSITNPCTLNMSGYVEESGAYVYAKPGSGFKMIAAMPMGAELKVVGMTGDKQWLRVQNGSKYGYVKTALMSKTPTLFPDGLF